MDQENKLTDLHYELDHREEGGENKYQVGDALIGEKYEDWGVKFRVTTHRCDEYRVPEHCTDENYEVYDR